MCIALYLPKYTTVDRETLINCYESNPDGFGYAYFDMDGNLQIRKFIGPEKISLGIEEFLLTRDYFKSKQFLAHFRIASHGKVAKKTCHPFKINDEMVFCHNGILCDFTKKLSIDSKVSDTMMFNRKVFQKLPHNFMNLPIYKKLLEEMIGQFNKMIIMRRDGQHWILNENVGEWHEGVWFSNDSYKPFDYITNYDYKLNTPHIPLYKRAYLWCKKFIEILPDVKEYAKELMEE